MPTVAVNVVRYNHSLPLIRDCIGSVLNQQFDAFTVTITENGSANSIREALLSSFGSDPRFSYDENETNLGFAGAHNRFILGTTADIVLPLNPDTVMGPVFLES